MFISPPPPSPLLQQLELNGKFQATASRPPPLASSLPAAPFTQGGRGGSWGIWRYPGGGLEVAWRCPRCALVVAWMCPGDALEVAWRCPGCGLEVAWRCTSAWECSVLLLFSPKSIEPSPRPNLILSHFQAGEQIFNLGTKTNVPTGAQPSLATA